jgi:hypothetical protein
MEFAGPAICLNVIQGSRATTVSSCPSVFNFSDHYYLRQQHRRCLPGTRCRLRYQFEPEFVVILPMSWPQLPMSLVHVVVPRVSKKSRESGEDEASSVIFTKCAIKSLDILRDTNSIHQNYSVEEKIFSHRLPKKRRPLDDVNRKPSSCLRLSRRISQGKLIRIPVN